MRHLMSPLDFSVDEVAKVLDLASDIEKNPAKYAHACDAVSYTHLQSIDFGSTAAAFSGGQGDFTVEFEPGASTLEKAGKGYVVASLGVDSGYVPYTAYSCLLYTSRCV